MVVPSVLLLAVIYAALPASGLGSKTEDRQKVVDKLIGKGPLNLVRPDGLRSDEGSDPVIISIRYALQSICVDIFNLRVETVGYLTMSWIDFRLAFNSDDVKDVRLATSLIWTPDIELYNAATPGLRIISVHNLAVIKASGVVIWIPQITTTTTCPSLTSTSTFNCSLRFGSWTYNGLDIDLALSTSELDLVDFVPNRQWRISSTSARRVVTHYPCCLEPYVTVEFNVTLQRRE